MSRKLREMVDELRDNPSGVRFNRLVKVVEALGYNFDRQKGSHEIYRRPGSSKLINLQRDGNLAKPYQVRQVIEIADAILGEEDER